MESIRKHLQPYSIAKRRITTINHAFASAIAPSEAYDPMRTARAIKDLGQNPDEELNCVYCGRRAETWDHVYGLVRLKQYSGYGHTLGNLGPCCSKCNSRKGGKEWTVFIQGMIKDKAELQKRITVMRSYFRKRSPQLVSLSQIEKLCPHEMSHMRTLQRRIISSMEEADEIAARMREKIGRRLPDG